MTASMIAAAMRRLRDDDCKGISKPGRLSWGRSSACSINIPPRAGGGGSNFRRFQNAQPVEHRFGQFVHMAGAFRGKAGKLDEVAGVFRIACGLAKGCRIVAKLLKSPQRWGLDFVPRQRLAARRALASWASRQAGLIRISIAVTDIEVRGDSCGDICLRDRRLFFSKWRKPKSHSRRHPRRYLVLRNLHSPLRLSWRRVWRRLREGEGLSLRSGIPGIIRIDRVRLLPRRDIEACGKLLFAGIERFRVHKFGFG